MIAMKLVALGQLVENSRDCLAPSATGKTSATTQAAQVKTPRLRCSTTRPR